MDFLYAGPTDAAATLLFAHGAGAAMDTPWMNEFCELLAERGVRTARFEFAYMAGRRSGIRRPPPRAETVIDEYLEAASTIESSGRLLIGGKSMGGRVASLIADDLHKAGTIAGLVAVGYPFHPMGKPEQLRTAHLQGLTAPMLICQGTRDTLGTVDEVAGYELSPAIHVQWLEDGDHSLRPRKVSGRTLTQNLAESADAIARFALAV